MAESIRNIMAKAYLNVLGNPHEARFVARMQRTITKAERRRKVYREKEGVEVPLPFCPAEKTVPLHPLLRFFRLAGACVKRLFR